MVLLVSCCIWAKAQDPHYSQFFSSPLTLNPALTGKFEGEVRVMGNYRNQWPTINRAYQTTTASVDFKILRNAIGQNDVWGLGFMGYSDKSADGAVKFNYGSVATSYHKGLDEDGYHQIGIGVQATYANMMINTGSLKFEDQLTPFGFTGTTSEIFSNNSLKTNYFDLNAGIVYTGSTTDNNNFYAGVSAYHINRPRQQFTGSYYALNPRITFHGGTYFPLNEYTTLHLSALHSLQAGAHETLAGGSVQLSPGATDQADKPFSLYLGGWARFGDAIIPYVGLETSGFRLGITYDVNTSSLKTASESRGGIEISLVYILKNPDNKYTPCPKY